MNDYITAKERTTFTLWQKIKYTLKNILRGNKNAK